MTDRPAYQDDLDQIVKNQTERGYTRKTEEEKKRAQRIASKRQVLQRMYAFHYIKNNLPELHEAIRLRAIAEVEGQK